MAAVGELVAARYRLVRPIAAGGLGRVWLATDERLGAPVALKQCAPPDGLTDGEEAVVRRLTVREARAFARVRHPNVVRVLEVLDGTGEPWIVMEFVPCLSLQEVIDQDGGLPPARVAEIGLAVLAGLAAAGRAGVLHLDVKPGNVLIADDGRILLTDFAPAVTDVGLAALAGAGIMFGSPRYLAPERLTGGAVTERADLWSLGATLYFAVEGRPPYARPTTEATLRAIAETAPEPPLRAGPLGPVIEGLMRRDPDQRWGAAQVTEELRRAVDRPGPENARPAKRRLMLVAAVLVVAAVAAGGARAATGGVHARPSPAAAPSPAVQLPAGFVWWSDPAGFRVGVPAGWDPAPNLGGGLRLDAPGGRASVRLGVWTSPGPDLVAALTAEERGVRLAGYRRVRIELLPESPDAVWEFIYRDPAAGPMRGMRRVLTSGGRTYLVDWRAPRQSWAVDQAPLAVLLATFTTNR